MTAEERARLRDEHEKALAHRMVLARLAAKKKSGDAAPTDKEK